MKFEDLNPYDSYKESDNHWLGKVPEHWDVLPLGGRLVERKEKNNPIKTRDILSLGLRTGVIPYSEKKTGGNKAKDDLSAYILAYPGDLVVNSMNVVVGSVGLSKYFGAVSPVYFVLRPRFSFDLIRYFDAVFHVATFQRSLFGLGNGIMFIESRSTGKLNTIRLRIPFSKLKRVFIPVPPPNEQELIVRFLDWASVRLGKAIASKRKVIGLLEEQKQAIIHRAVTRGLDDTVPFNPSSLDWLGDVPEHWELRRAKYLFREIDERSRTGTEELLSVSHITGVTLRSQKNITMFKARSYVGHKICREHDLVINTMWAWMAALGVSGIGGIVSPAYAVYRPRGDELVDGFLDLLLRISAYRSEFLSRSTGIRLSRMRLYPEAFFRIPILVPPKREQIAIVESISSSTSSLDRNIDFLHREILLLREYRARLIADVVTGKLDVQEFARTLPADIAKEAAELASAELGDEEYSDADDELADEFAGEPV